MQSFLKEEVEGLKPLLEEYAIIFQPGYSKTLRTWSLRFRKFASKNSTSQRSGIGNILQKEIMELKEQRDFAKLDLLLVPEQKNSFLKRVKSWISSQFKL